MEELFKTFLMNVRAMLEQFMFGPLSFSRYRVRVFRANVTLLANANGTATANLGATENWVVLKIHSISTSTFNCMLSTDSPQENITDQALPNASLFGTAAARADGLPPFRLKAGARLLFNCTDTSGAGNTITLAVYVRAIDGKLDL